MKDGRIEKWLDDLLSTIPLLLGAACLKGNRQRAIYLAGGAALYVMTGRMQEHALSSSESAQKSLMTCGKTEERLARFYRTKQYCYLALAASSVVRTAFTTLALKESVNTTVSSWGLNNTAISRSMIDTCAAAAAMSINNPPYYSVPSGNKEIRSSDHRAHTLVLHSKIFHTIVIPIRQLALNYFYFKNPALGCIAAFTVGAVQRSYTHYYCGTPLKKKPADIVIHSTSALISAVACGYFMDPNNNTSIAKTIGICLASAATQTILNSVSNTIDTWATGKS